MSITVREALCRAMSKEMRLNPDVFLIGEEVAEYNGAYKVSQGMLNEFGANRVIDTPITEEGFAGLAIGAGFAGLRPIVEFMSFNFSLQAIDQVINSAAKTHYMSGGNISCPIVFRGPNGAASQVAAQHSQCLASFYAHIPGLIVLAPYDAFSAQALLRAAIQNDNPVIFLENELMYGKKFDENNNIFGYDDNSIGVIGKAHILQNGSDITIISFSAMLNKCLNAVDILQKDYDISAELIDLRSIRPLDLNTIFDSIKKTNNVLIVEESWPYASVSSEIISLICENIFDYLDSEPARLCGRDIPMPYAKNLEELSLPQENDIIKRVCQILNV